MKRTPEFRTTASMRCFLSLVLLLGLSFACQESQSSNSSLPKPSEEPSKKQVIAPSANDQSGGASAANNTDHENSGRPGIRITQVPPRGAGDERLETIAGTVSGVNVEECQCKVVIFAGTNTWYVQPWIDKPNTLINGDKTWRNDTHLGYQYAALLVKNSYPPPSTTGRLPEVGGEVLAITIVNGKE